MSADEKETPMAGAIAKPAPADGSAPGDGARSDGDMPVDYASPDATGPVPFTSSSIWLTFWLCVTLLSLGTAIASTTWALGGLVLPMLCLVVCLAAAVTDGGVGVIPNGLTLPAILVGLAMNGWYDLALALNAPAPAFLGAAGISDAGLGLLVLGGCGIACILFAGMGGGDMKLLAALGAMLGLAPSIIIATLALVVAIPYSLINLAVRGRLNALFSFLVMGTLETIFTKRLPKDRIPFAQRNIPLAIPLLAGLILWQVLPEAWISRFI